MRRISLLFTLFTGLLIQLVGCSHPHDQLQRNVIRKRVPHDLELQYRTYLKLPPPKAFCVALAPDGTWAYGQSSAQPDLKEAVKKAAIRCEHARRKFKISQGVRVFAINNDYVFECDQDAPVSTL